MASSKQTVIDMIKRLPEEASLEDIQYHLFVLQKAQSGLGDSDAGRVLSQEQVEKQLEKWTAR